jgi:peptide chain release factor subunit 1
LSAITSTQQRLKLYDRCPPNGLVVYCGTVVTEDGKKRKDNIAFEPFKPINKSLYWCDNQFHTEYLSELLMDDESFGFIVMDGNGSLYGTVQGSNRTILHKFSVDLPKKHGRGGQSALRFARLRLEKRHNYVRKVAEMATQLFLPNDGQKPNVRGLVLAGSADFKSELMRSGLFDPRLAKIVLKMVDIGYGGEQGFQQAIELAADTLSNVKLVKEKKLLQAYMREIALDTGKYCFTVDDTIRALEYGAVEHLIVWDNLDLQRYKLRNTSSGAETIVHLTKEQQGNAAFFRDPDGAELETIETEPLVEWLATNFKQYGCNLEFITDRSGEGTQFVQGFGGIGAILRWSVDFAEMAALDDAHRVDHVDDDDEEEEEPDAEYGFDDGDFAF